MLCLVAISGKFDFTCKYLWHGHLSKKWRFTHWGVSFDYGGLACGNVWHVVKMVADTLALITTY